MSVTTRFTLAAAVAAILAVPACFRVPPARPPSPTTASAPPSVPVTPPAAQSPPDPDAWKTAARGSFAAEILSVEIRPVKVKPLLSEPVDDGPVSLIVRVRLTNSDDTVRVSSLDFAPSTPTDEFGNRYEWLAVDAGFLLQIAEPDDSDDLTPDKPAVRTFVFEEPIPKATRVRFVLTGEFDRARVRPVKLPFTVPLPGRR